MNTVQMTQHLRKRAEKAEAQNARLVKALRIVIDAYDEQKQGIFTNITGARALLAEMEGKP